MRKGHKLLPWQPQTHGGESDKPREMQIAAGPMTCQGCGRHVYFAREKGIVDPRSRNADGSVHFCFVR